jgi:spore maturation protein CgeB
VKLLFKFPAKKHVTVHDGVPYQETAAIYKSHVASLNVNSVTDSESMCSRRLLEILACGGIAVTNRSPAVDKHFRDYCHVVENRSEAAELFARLRGGPSGDDLARAEAGAAYVRSAHSWERRLEELNEKIPF